MRTPEVIAAPSILSQNSFCKESLVKIDMTLTGSTCIGSSVAIPLVVLEMALFLVRSLCDFSASRRHDVYEIFLVKLLQQFRDVH